jgi:hypothetical protein
VALRPRPTCHANVLSYCQRACAQVDGERLLPQPLVIPEFGRAKLVPLEQRQQLLVLESRQKRLALEA